MKQQIEQLINHAITSMKQQGLLSQELMIDVAVSSTRDRQHGDYSCNLAMILAKKVGMKPRELAAQVIAAIAPSEGILKIEIAGPGFINFYLSDDSKQNVIADILDKKYDFGRVDKLQGQSVLLEFISANPTGPLHVGHGRSAAFGATLADILEAAGHSVHREYYVNDAGRQMNILAVSVYLRYLQCHGVSCDFPANAYKGEYVKDIAERLTHQDGKQFVVEADDLFQGLPLDETDGGDKEIFIDALIERVRQLLGEEQYQLLHQFGLNIILDDIRDDLAQFGVRYQEWFSEQQLFADGAIEKGINALKASDLTYTKEGALWFKATEFGDEKDRVLIRENGQPTYFASDVAYHWNKYDRGFDRVIDIFGADHHGYMSRLRAAVSALGHDNDAFDILLVQFAILYQGSERLSMSTRAGSFVTLRQLREDVGNDAARFFYVMRKSEQHMDFDLDLAKSQSNDNPVYYIQYAYARISSVFRQMQEKSIAWDKSAGLSALSRLNTEHESKLLAALAHYPELIKRAAKLCEPHLLAYYLRELANDFHTYYNAHQFLVDDAALRDARLCLIEAVRQVLENGLHLIGVSTPEHM